MHKKETIVNAKGLRCPIPIFKASKALESMNPGEIMRLYTTDPSTKIDIPRLVKRTGDELLSVEEKDDSILFVIRKH